MVILEFTYSPHVGFEHFKPGYHARIQCRINGHIFDGGSDGCCLRLRNCRTTRYKFINMGQAVRSLLSQLRFEEGTHHLTN